MKLISLNVEGKKHLDKVLPFLEHERADVVCLQEASNDHVLFLQSQGYTVSFEPRCIKEYQGVDFIEGILFASLHPATFQTHFYYRPRTEVIKEDFDSKLDRNNTLRAIIVGTIIYEGNTYTICTTHFTWSPNGDSACHAQKGDMQKFLNIIRTLPPHLMCGDFNIPRNYNSLYQTLISNYTDNIPEHYQTSLDSAFHKLTDSEEKKHLLEKYMVDYIFSKPPYRIENVRLQFAISDHAAVIATVLTLK